MPILFRHSLDASRLDIVLYQLALEPMHVVTQTAATAKADSSRSAIMGRSFRMNVARWLLCVRLNYVQTFLVSFHPECVKVTC